MLKRNLRDLSLNRFAILLMIVCVMPVFTTVVNANIKADQTHTVKRKKKPSRKHRMTNTQTTQAVGQWGGMGISLTVGQDSSRIQYDCASGEITEKLTVDRNGNFSARGFHTHRTPGPEREDQPPARQPATYTGHIAGDQMTLKVILTADGTQVGNFQLERGNGGRLHRCY